MAARAPDRSAPRSVPSAGQRPPRNMSRIVPRMPPLERGRDVLGLTDPLAPPAPPPPRPCPRMSPHTGAAATEPRAEDVPHVGCPILRRGTLLAEDRAEVRHAAGAGLLAEHPHH